MDKVILQEAYDEWTTKVEEAIRVVQTKVKKRNTKIMVKKLQRIKQVSGKTSKRLWMKG